MGGHAFVSVDAEGMPYIVGRPHRGPGDKLSHELRGVVSRVTYTVAEEPPVTAGVLGGMNLYSHSDPGRRKSVGGRHSTDGLEAIILIIRAGHTGLGQPGCTS